MLQEAFKTPVRMKDSRALQGRDLISKDVAAILL